MTALTTLDAASCKSSRSGKHFAPKANEDEDVGCSRRTSWQSGLCSAEPPPSTPLRIPAAMVRSAGLRGSPPCCWACLVARCQPLDEEMPA